ncbi:hypothetical protein AB0O28_18895 [Microbispora sp. NPDC088329]|uniref:hypothetical protein n=1 Tax=Microbispora sp. NPDC088329 TaxID=3154869 RepID=UPI00341425BF
MSAVDVPGTTWEERMSQRARARQAAIEEAERAARQARYRAAVEEWTARLPALPGEIRVLEGDCAGHLEHHCGPITRCTCGELRNPICFVPPLPGEVIECPICEARPTRGIQ